MEEVGICKEDLDVEPPRDRPEFESLQGEDEYDRQIRKAGVVGTCVLFDWYEDGTKEVRRQRLRSHGNVEINDPEEEYFSELYKKAYEELFQAVYGHPHRYASRKAYMRVHGDEEDDEDDEDDKE